MDKKLSVIFLSLFIVLFLLRVPLVFERFFDQDEFEHIHAAWNISQGQLIYSEFFENHPPMIHYLIQPLFHVTGDTLGTVYGARILMLLFTGGIFFFCYLIARDLFGRLAASLSILTLSTMIMFLEKSLEFRPDLPMTFFWFSGLYLALRSLRRGGAGFFAAGVFVAAGVLFSPKAIFGYLGIAAALAFLRIRGHEKMPGALLFFHAGLVIPLLVFTGWLYWAGNLADFWQWNIAFNAKMSAVFRPHLLGFVFARSFSQNILFWIAALPGIVWLFRARQELFPEKAVLIFSLFFLVAGLFINPSPNRQYYLLFLPILSITASLFLADLVGRLLEKRGYLRFAAAAVLVILFMLPLKEVYGQFFQKNTEQIEVINYVLESTGSRESVFDCWTGLYLFRPNASFYHYLNLDILSAVDVEALGDQLIRELRGNNCKVVIVDRHMQHLPERVRRFIGRHYLPSPRYPQVLIRKALAF